MGGEEGAGDAGVHGLDGGGIDDGAPDACLEDDGIEVGGLESVEDIGEFFLLPVDGLWGGGLGVGPVEVVDGGEPHGP